MTEDTFHNDLTGATRDVVQAGRVTGGLHFHSRDVDGGERLPPRQLPADVRGFVNRAAELDRLDLVLAGTAPDANAAATCVIAGTAGVGKTSLAVHWAHRVAESFPDGQLYVNLHGYDPGPPVTAGEVLDRFLRALNVPATAIPADIESRAALYRSQLAGRQVLVVLDNAATTNQVRPLLPGVSGCLVLVTSRSRLSGLVARDGAHRLTLALLSDQEAVELLRAVISGHRLSDESRDLEELAKLCARLPLALRIAAERAISRPWTSMRALINDLRDESELWDALTAEEDDESDAVRTVFAWSYRALPQEAGRLFRFLGLHPGPDFSDAAAAALVDLPVGRTRRLLDSLVGAHLLEQLQPDRYQFHDLLRLYALDQARAEESPEAYQQAVRRILVWYAHSLTEAGTLLAPEGERLPLPELSGAVAPMRFGDYQMAHVWFAHEEPVLNAAVHFADEVLMPDLAWLLAALLYPVYANRNQVDHWITTSTLGLGAARQLNDRDGEARTLSSLGKAHTQSSRPRDGIRYQEAALAIHQELGNRTGEVTSTNAVGLAHLRLRELADALRHFERTSAVADELGSDFWRATSANNTANVLLELEQFAEAADLLRSALPTHRRLNMRGAEGDTLRGLSHAHRGIGVPDEAREFVDEALTIARDQENIAWEAHWLVESGHVLLDLNDPAEALVAYQRAAVLHRRLGDRGREAAALDGAGLAYQRLDRPDEAADFHRLAVAAFRDIGDQWQLAAALTNLATALDGDTDANREALDLLSPFSDPRSVRLQEEIRARLS
jgi:tetratricopeptide (TPR) repeat protein